MVCVLRVYKCDVYMVKEKKENMRGVYVGKGSGWGKKLLFLLR